MLDKYKHVSFDLDNTLIYADPRYRYEIVPKVVEQLGGKIRERRHIDIFWHEVSRDEAIKKYFFLEPDDFWPVFRIHDAPEQRTSHTFAYEDAARTLVRLKALGKQISIITGSPAHIAEIGISKLNNAPYDLFLSLWSAGFHEKPSPEGMAHALKMLGVLAEETLYIGNSNEDALFAEAAGCDFIHIDREEHDYESWDNNCARIFSFDELFA